MSTATERTVGVTAFLVAVVGGYLSPMFRVTLEVLRPMDPPERTETVTRLADQLPLIAYFGGFGDPSVSSELAETSQWLAVIILAVLIAGIAAVVRGHWLAATAASTIATLLAVYNLFAVPIILARLFDSGAGAAGGRVSLSAEPHLVGITVILVALLIPIAVSTTGYMLSRRRGSVRPAHLA